MTELDGNVGRPIALMASVLLFTTTLIPAAPAHRGTIYTAENPAVLYTLVGTNLVASHLL